jgi:hypothetical protein
LQQQIFESVEEQIEQELFASEVRGLRDVLSSD